MKNSIIEDNLENLAKFVNKRFQHYEQRLKWHDEEFNDNADEHVTMTNLLIGSYVIHLLLFIYLIIKGV